MKSRKKVNYMIGLRVENKVNVECSDEDVNIKYCESFCFGKGCKEIKTCEIYKRAKESHKMERK